MKKEIFTYIKKLPCVLLSATLTLTLLAPTNLAFANESAGQDGVVTEQGSDTTQPSPEILPVPLTASSEDAALQTEGQASEASVAPTDASNSSAFENSTASTSLNSSTEDSSSNAATDTSEGVILPTDATDDEELLWTPLGLRPAEEVREAAFLRDLEMQSLIDIVEGNSSFFGMVGSTSTGLNWNYTGKAYCEFKNRFITDNEFNVTINGTTYTGYCMDETLPAPADGTYTYYAFWDEESYSYEITLDTRAASIHPAQVNTGLGCQRVGGIKLKDNARVQIIKQADAGSCVEADPNGLYSLEGAQYGLYWYYQDAINKTNPEHVFTLHYNPAKNRYESEIFTTPWPATYYSLRELKAPSGYTLDEQIYFVDVAPTSVISLNEFTVSDTPIMDPDGVLIHKVNEKGETAPKGDSSLAFAQYRFDYYDAYYYAIDELPTTPTRSWTLRTNENGYAGLRYANESFTAADGQSYGYFVEGDELYLDEGGYVNIPLGTVVVREVVSPAGYELSNEVFLSRYIADATQPSGGRWEGPNLAEDAQTAGPTILAKEAPKTYSMQVYKTVQGTDTVSPAGITFEVVLASTGVVYETLTIGEDGYSNVAEDLPYGTYEIREVEDSLPKDADGSFLIQPYSHTSGTGSNVVEVVNLADETYDPREVITVECVDYTTGTPSVSKTDADTNEPLSNVEFTLYRYTGNTSIVDGAVVTDTSALDTHGSYWEKLDSLTTDEYGIASFEHLPYGIYMIEESRSRTDYMNATESLGKGTDPRDTALIFVLDKTNDKPTQFFTDKAITIECNVDKSTIEVTSAGLVYKDKSGGNTINNVSIEEYRYDVSFDNGNTNTFSDEYWVIDELEMTAAPYDLRVNKIMLPSVINDTNAGTTLLIRTNKSDADSWTPTVEVREGSLCDGTSRFNGTGWRYVGTGLADGAVFNTTELGLTEDEYITGICLYYGAVEPGFKTTSPLSYMVSATHPLAEGTIIPNTASSHITRNWNVLEGTPGGLEDNDEDKVVTTVLTTFETTDSYKLTQDSYGHIGTYFPNTGDKTSTIVSILIALMVVSGLCLLFEALRRKNKGVTSMKNIALSSVLACVLALSLTGCAKQEEVITHTLSIAATTEVTDFEGSASIELTDEEGNAQTHVVELNAEEPLTLDLTEGTYTLSVAEYPEASDEQPSWKLIEDQEIKLTDNTDITLVFELEDAVDATDTEETTVDSAEKEKEATATNSTSKGGSSQSSSYSNTSTSSSVSSSQSTSSSSSSSSNSGSSASTPSHTHSWTWVPNVVTVTDRPAYDEPVYRWENWCNACNCEVPLSHNEEMMLQGLGGHTLFTKKVVDYYIHHEAITHTVDKGHYACACGATK